MSEILSCLHANKQIVFHVVLDVDRRHENPRKETKDFITNVNISS